MSFKDLPKEKRELIILGVMGVLTVVFLIQNLLLGPASQEAAKATKTIEELEPKVRRADRLVRDDRGNREKSIKLSSQILQITDKQIPPEASRYLWALQRVSDVARTVGLQVNVREHPGLRYMPHRKPFEEIRANASFWATYAVEIQTSASYQEVIEFLSKLTAENPQASLGMLSILASETSPEQHTVQMIIEWPVPRESAALAALRKNVEKQP